EEVHHAVVRERAEFVTAFRVAEELLILGVPVIAEAEFKTVHAASPRHIDLRIVVLGGVMPRRGAHVFSGEVRRAEAAPTNARQRLRTVAEKRAGIPSVG